MEIDPLATHIGPLTSVFDEKSGRSGWAVLAAGALVASLLAVGASPAAALDEDSKPNAAAATSACVGDATGDMMFSDVSEGHAFRGDINCLAYYGVTIGYGDGTFRPNADVSNEEMVLFMERAAAAAGADAEAVVGDFADTGSDPVHRGDMALLIARLLVASTTKESTPNVTNNADGTFAVSTVMAADWDYFADSRGSQNRVHDSAASALYELGVAKGTGMGNFSPASTVSRGAMAAFITRALAHTTARPEGVTVQELATGGAKVSVRDADFRPVANASLDLFSIATANLDRAFRNDGACNVSQLADASGGSGSRKCEIDFIDPVTQVGTGDYDQAITAAKGGTTLWVWTGEVGDKVTRDSEGVAMINLTKSSPTTGAHVKVSTSEPRNITLTRFGSTVTVTVQLVDTVDAANNAVPTPAQRDLSFGLTIRECRVTNNGTDANAVLTTCDAATAEKVDTSGAFKLGPTGEATFDVTLADPDTDDTGDDNPDTGVVTYVIVLPTEITIATGSTATGDVDFSEAASVVTAVSVSTPIAYAMVPASGTAGNTAVVMVTDQYGAGMAGQSVVLSRADANASRSNFPTQGRRTGVDGRVRIGYAHNTEQEAETFTATVTLADGSTTVTGDATFYWVTAGAAGDVTARAVVAGDLEKNEIVVAGDVGGTTTYMLLRYDSNDQFTVTDTDTTGSTAAGYGITTFEEWLAKDMGITPTLTTETAQTLSWGGYDATYSGGVASWTLSGSTT